ncbi:MAG: AAA family ATPase [Gemmataceae bacterium]
MSKATSDGTLTLDQAKALLRCLAAEESVLLLSSPGVGKSDIVQQAAAEAGLECRSLLGTQIAPEDVSGVPKLVNQRTVFCPPRVVLPDPSRPFCLFLDELPAAPPEVQKAFYSLLLERRLGEHRLPPGTWVVAAGNRTQDNAMTQMLSSALVNRVFIVQLRIDVPGWLRWAGANGIRSEIRAFIRYVPHALGRPVPREPVPFSTPRSWALLSHDLGLAEQAGSLTSDERRALAFGRLSSEDAGLFCALAEEGLAQILPLEDYLDDPDLLPEQDTALWFIVSRLRKAVERGELKPVEPDSPDGFAHKINALLAALPYEFRFAALLDLVTPWAELGASETMLQTLKDVTGL